MEEGVVPGGGLALPLAGNVFKELTEDGKGNIGSKIINNAILAPIKRIAANAGKDGSLVLYNIMEKNKDGQTAIGYNAATNRFEDMVAAGIIDPTKVVRSALENAALLLKTSFPGSKILPAAASIPAIFFISWSCSSGRPSNSGTAEIISNIFFIFFSFMTALSN